METQIPIKKRGRGRPPGSKNKKGHNAGRPVGSKSGDTLRAEMQSLHTYYQKRLQAEQAEKARLRMDHEESIYKIVAKDQITGEEMIIYIGQTDSKKNRASNHASAGVLKRYKEDHGDDAELYWVESQRFTDQEVADSIHKEWANSRESYYMMLYKQHKYNNLSYNKNSVGDIDRFMKEHERELDILNAKPNYRLYPEERRLQKNLRIALDNYREFDIQNKNIDV